MIDWMMIVLRLRRHFTGESLAKLVDAHPATIRRIGRGEVNEPKFGTGVRLLDLHHDRCPHDHSKIDLFSCK